MLPDEHQHHTTEFILTAGLLPELPLELPGIHHRNTERWAPLGVYGPIRGNLTSLSRPPGVNRRLGAATYVAVDFLSPKSSFTILPASDLKSPHYPEPEVSIPARAGNPAILRIFVKR